MLGSEAWARKLAAEAVKQLGDVRRQLGGVEAATGVGSAELRRLLPELRVELEALSSLVERLENGEDHERG